MYALLYIITTPSPVLVGSPVCAMKSAGQGDWRAKKKNVLHINWNQFLVCVYI